MNKKQPKPFTIGLCGEPGSGKTQFAFQLLTEAVAFNAKSWKIEELTDSAKEYYQALSKEIEQRGLSSTSSEHQISLFLPNKIQSSEQSDSGIQQFDIIDQSGNAFVDFVESGKGDSFIQLIKNSDVLIYPINPANPEFTSELYIQNLKEHIHQLLRTIAKKRGNRYLPVYFLFTHKNVLESKQDADKEEIQKQMDSLLAFIKQEYQNRYHNTFPRDLASSQKASGIFDLTQDGAAMQIFENTLNLHGCLDEYEKKFRSRVKIVYIPLFIILGLLVIGFISYYYLSKRTKGVDNSLVAISQRVEILEQWHSDQIEENQKLEKKSTTLKIKSKYLRIKTRLLKTGSKHLKKKLRLHLRLSLMMGITNLMTVQRIKETSLKMLPMEKIVMVIIKRLLTMV